MSDTMNTPLNRRAIRRQLLSTVSVLTLIGSVYGTGHANAAGSDKDRPTFWIELGGQAETIAGQGEPFTPSFMAANANVPVFSPVSPLQAQKAPQFSFGGEGKISFQPEGSNWIFSASIRYGRSNSQKSIQQQTGQPLPPGYSWPPGYAQSLAVANYAQFKTQHRESHAVLDFQVGKDVGLGMFGNSVFNAGVRVAQFSDIATADMKVRPKFTREFILHYGYTDYSLTGQSASHFHGVGPSLSWNGSLPVEGNLDEGELTVDWGANAALLFGRQAATVHHKTAALARYFQYRSSPVTVYQHTSDPHRVRSVTVPNLGGFAGLSYRFSRAAISVGYRSDFFFGAVDGGIDSRKSETLGFRGPFATVSMGLGG